MSIGILAFSQKGHELGQRIAGSLTDATVTRCPKGGLDNWTKEHFFRDNLIIYVSSCGIAVRAIAPYVVSKTSDPAVIVVDETGKFAISLLSGHLGGANAWTKRICEIVGSEPVITTATDRNGIFAVDTWAREQGITVKNTNKIVDISSALLAGKTVEIGSDFEIEGKLPDGVLPGKEGFLVSYQQTDKLCLVPRILTLGVGCKKDIPVDRMKDAFQRMLDISGIYPEAIGKIASIDIKKEEKAIHWLAEELGVPSEFYSADVLKAAPGEFTASKFVASVVGVDNVCERSAVVGSHNGTIILRKQALDGVTMALAAESYKIKF